MNNYHDHAKATVSSEADELETEIESIQNEIVLLYRELVNRVRKNFEIYKNIKDLRIIGGVALLAVLGIFLYIYVRRK